LLGKVGNKHVPLTFSKGNFVCACSCVHMFACTCVCVRMGACVCMDACLRASVHTYVLSACTLMLPLHSLYCLWQFQTTIRLKNWQFLTTTSDQGTHTHAHTHAHAHKHTPGLISQCFVSSTYGKFQRGYLRPKMVRFLHAPRVRAP